MGTEIGTDIENALVTNAPAQLIGALMLTYQERVLKTRPREKRSEECLWNGHRITWAHDPADMHVLNIRIYPNALEAQRLHKRLVMLNEELGVERNFLAGKAPSEIDENDISDADERLLYIKRYRQAETKAKEIEAKVAETELLLKNCEGVRTLSVDLRKYENSFSLIANHVNGRSLLEMARSEKEPEEVSRETPPAPEPDDPARIALHLLSDDELIAKGIEAGLETIPDERDELINAILAAPPLPPEDQAYTELPAQLSLDEALSAPVADMSLAGLRAVGAVLGIPRINEWGKGALADEIEAVRAKWPSAEPARRPKKERAAKEK